MCDLEPNGTDMCGNTLDALEVRFGQEALVDTRACGGHLSQQAKIPRAQCLARGLEKTVKCINLLRGVMCGVEAKCIDSTTRRTSVESKDTHWRERPGEILQDPALAVSEENCSIIEHERVGRYLCSNCQISNRILGEIDGQCIGDCAYCRRYVTCRGTEAPSRWNRTRDGELCPEARGAAVGKRHFHRTAGERFARRPHMNDPAGIQGDPRRGARARVGECDEGAVEVPPVIVKRPLQNLAVMSQSASTTHARERGVTP